MQHMLESNSSALTLTIALRRFSCSLFLAFIVTEDTTENILSTTALLTEVIKQVRAKVVSSLNALCRSTPIQNCSVSTGMELLISNRQKAFVCIVLQFC